MLKRKADAGVGPQGTPRKTARKTNNLPTAAAANAMPGPYTSAQKGAIAEFTGVTELDKSSAGKMLKLHNWNVQAAMNAYFNNPNNAPPNPHRAGLNKLFDKYRDDAKNEPDLIDVEGAQTLLGDMSLDLGGMDALVFFELVQSPSLPRITREGFVDGCSEAGVDTLPKLRNIVLQRRAQLQSDRTLYRNVYNHTFTLALQSGQKSLQLEIAVEFWRMLFSPAGYDWRSPASPWVDWWLEFMESRWKKSVNKDLWRQTLAFADQTLKDTTLAFWTEESSWPSVIDDFVEWIKTEKRGGGSGLGGGGVAGDAMDVE